MHISEGVLSAPVLIGCGALAAGGVAVGLRRLDEKTMVHTAVVSSALFVSSLIMIPIGGTTVHLVLNGLAGLILGIRIFPAYAVAFVLQAFLGVGGFSTLGVNIIVMAVPGYLFGLLLGPVARHTNERKASIGGFCVGSLSILLSGIFLAVVLLSAGKEFAFASAIAVAVHVILMFIEGVVALFAVRFLRRVRPEALGIRSQTLEPLISASEQASS